MPGPHPRVPDRMLPAQEVAQLYQTAFVRSARAVGALWAVCSLCFAVLEVVVLTEPAWVGAGPGGVGEEGVPGLPAGAFGLFQACVETGGPPECRGSVSGLWPLPAFTTAAVFVGGALGLVLASVLSLGLYRLCSPATLYKVCGWLQLSAASCQALGCLTFADGWETEEVRRLCGPGAARYSLGRCSLRWAFSLALIGILDALVLSVLAFVLASRQDTLLPQDFRPAAKGHCPPIQTCDLELLNTKATPHRPVGGGRPPPPAACVRGDAPVTPNPPGPQDVGCLTHLTPPLAGSPERVGEGGPPAIPCPGSVRLRDRPDLRGEQPPAPKSPEDGTTDPATEWDTPLAAQEEFTGAL
ncbi:LHFPL tetraspan subfamily member 3 protein-like [Pristis pectinata]|uniref:LHFPL tetraspan subfamily member 3 protein-like n=1 Tax=Pristis pectinata TaxID=685728 RepID=UPI00223E59DC|nr:LHFPL tetraspan subfamily member 3 protein-like [Pristis pectinata]